jgi:hypothetical protein
VVPVIGVYMETFFLKLLLCTTLIPFGPRRSVAEADPPTAPGLSFDLVKIAARQTARLNARSVGPGSCGGGITFEFYGVDGELLKRTVVPRLEPDKSASIELRHDEAQRGSSAAKVRAVLRFGWDKGYPPSAQAVRIYQCHIQPKLEVLEQATGKTILVSTDARRLPERIPPRK